MHSKPTHIMPRAARNLPSTTSCSATGSVINPSKVPLFRSSAMRRMVMAGTNSMNNSGHSAKKPRIDALPTIKSPEK